MATADVFFFQAEDGIRDYKVTGVQTCALPIYQAGAERKMRVGETQRGEIEAHEVMLFRLVTLLDAADVAGNQRALGNGDAGSAEGAIQPRRNWITHGGLVESDRWFKLQVQVNAGGALWVLRLL